MPSHITFVRAATRCYTTLLCARSRQASPENPLMSCPRISSFGEERTFQACQTRLCIPCSWCELWLDRPAMSLVPWLLWPEGQFELRIIIFLTWHPRHARPNDAPRRPVSNPRAKSRKIRSAVSSNLVDPWLLWPKGHDPRLLWPKG